MVVPVYSSVWIASSTVAGLVYFDEWATLARNRRKLALFLAGALVALSGVFFLARDAADADSRRGDEASAAYGAVDDEAPSTKRPPSLRKVPSQTDPAGCLL